MKTIEHKQLFLKNERSDKIYEAELCEVREHKYVVNFRYGRRGTRMIEGTKTVFPVTYEEAKAIFDKLVDSKEAKGYSTSNPVPIAETREPTVAQSDKNSLEQNHARDQAIMQNLMDISSGSYTGTWKTSRIIWRAGELKLAAAADLIVPYLNSSDEMEAYSAIWALARMRSLKGYDLVYNLYLTKKDAKCVRIASALLLLVPGKYKEQVKKDIEQEIPSFIRERIDAPSDTCLKRIREYIGSGNKETPAFLVNIYLLSLLHDNLAETVRELMDTIPAKQNFYKGIRHVYKLAELLDDYPMYALAAKKIAISHTVEVNYAYVKKDGLYIREYREPDSPDRIFQYPSSTNIYMARRGLRHLNKIIHDRPSEYLDLASALLLAANDERDGQKVKRQSAINYAEGDWTIRTFWLPKYHLFPAYLSILYHNSSRFIEDDKGKKFALKDEQHEVDELSVEREERFPERWDQSPSHVIRLLANSSADAVSNFALKVYHANPHFKNHLSPQDLCQIVGSPHRATVLLGIALLKERYSGVEPPFPAFINLLKSKEPEAKDLADALLEKHPSLLESNTVLSQLILLGKKDLLDLILNSTADLKALEAFEFAHLHALLENDSIYSDDFIDALSLFVQHERVNHLFSAFSITDLNCFLEHERLSILQLSLRLVHVNQRPGYDLAAPFIEKFLESEHDSLRSAAIDLLHDFPEAYLLEHAELIFRFIFSVSAAVRQAIQPTAAKLIQLDEEHKEALFDKLIGAISQLEIQAGMHDDFMLLLNTYYQRELQSIDEKNILLLVLSNADAAQRMGEQLFYSKGLDQHFGLSDWLRVKDADSLKVRDSLLTFFSHNKELIKNELEESLKILDSTWDDIRGRAFDFYMNETSTEDWNLDLVLMIIDNPKEDVQAFGRSLISRLFSSERGKDLMLHMSEHPSRSMMLFTSNYLSLHARDSEATILLLKQYFKNILFGVNVGAAAKARVFRFIREESVKSMAVAEMTTDIISNLIGTNAVKDMSECLDILLEIHDRHEGIHMPISIKPISPYSHVI